ncbi:putative U-box domain-containing protein 4-like [Capsicum annuum]|nr:putative U-box domain-containing protein 4-like [Capsicum annuum]
MTTSFPMNASNSPYSHSKNSFLQCHKLVIKCPEELLDEKSPAWNKGSIHYVDTSNVEVLNAYVAQFEKDMEMLLNARAEEIVEGGMMVIISAQSSECLVKFFGSSLMDLVYGEIIMARFTNMGCGAVDETVLPLTRGRRFDPGYGENSVGSTATLMGPSTRDPN